MLSNFDSTCVFEWNGHKWKSIEHAFQSSKIALENEEVAYKFTVDSGDIIGKSDGNIAQKNRKIIKLSSKNIAEWSNIRDSKMSEISKAKYEQCKVVRDMLLCTKNADLYHLSVQRGQESKLIRFKHLEAIRSSFV